MSARKSLSQATGSYSHGALRLNLAIEDDPAMSDEYTGDVANFGGSRGDISG
jgi:hypothetical protein